MKTCQEFSDNNLSNVFSIAFKLLHLKMTNVVPAATDHLMCIDRN